MRVFRREMANGRLSPTYYVQAEVNGKRIVKSTGCKTERDALKVARDLVQPLRKMGSAKAIVEEHRRLLTGAEDIRLEEAWKRFESKPRAGAVTRKQLDANGTYWGDFVAFIEGEYPTISTLPAVTRAHAEAYLSHIRRFGRYQKTFTYKRGRKTVDVTIKKERKYSPRTLNAYHDAVKMVFDALRIDAGLMENPFDGVARVRNEYESRESFTLDEIRKLYDAADDFLKPLLVVMCNTGLRRGDASTLLWSEVDLEKGWIQRRMEKTGRMVRIPMLPGFWRYLVERREQHPDDKEVLPDIAAMYRGNNDGLSYRMKALIDDTLEAVATEHVDGRTRAVSRRDCHSFRHAYLTLAAAAGVPQHLLQQLAGHATASMTARYTDHPDDELLRLRMAAVPDPIPFDQPAQLIAPVDPAKALVVANQKLADLATRLAQNDVPEAVREVCMIIINA